MSEFAGYYYAEIDENFNWNQTEVLGFTYAYPLQFQLSDTFIYLGAYDNEYHYLSLDQKEIIIESIDPDEYPWCEAISLVEHKGDRILALVDGDYYNEDDFNVTRLIFFKNGVEDAVVYVPALILGAVYVYQGRLYMVGVTYDSEYIPVSAGTYAISLDTYEIEQVSYTENEYFLGILASYSDSPEHMQVNYEPEPALFLVMPAYDWAPNDEYASFVFYLCTLPSEEVPFESDPPTFEYQQLKCSKPLIVMRSPTPESDLWLHFRIRAFADASGSQLISEVDSITAPERFQYSPDNGTTWRNFPADGLPPEQYGSLVKVRVDVGPRRKVWLRASVGA